MTKKRVEKLLAKLVRGREKTTMILLEQDLPAWDMPITDAPSSWKLRDLIAHFISAEEHLLLIAKDIVAGGGGSPNNIDIDAFNEEQLQLSQHLTPTELMEGLERVRDETIAFTKTLDDEKLTFTGQHPTLGETTVETIIFSTYAHQLLHLRETNYLRN